MRVVIAGPRDCFDYKMLKEAIEKSPFKNKITQVISGGATGVDKMGEKWAKENDIPVRVFKADWNDTSHPDAIIRTNKWGKEYDAGAGFRRNEEMAQNADGVIAIDLGTNGTADMIEQGRKYDLEVFTYPPQKKTLANTVYDF